MNGIELAGYALLISIVIAGLYGWFAWNWTRYTRRQWPENDDRELRSPASWRGK